MKAKACKLHHHVLVLMAISPRLDRRCLWLDPGGVDSFVPQRDAYVENRLMRMAEEKAEQDKYEAEKKAREEAEAKKKKKAAAAKKK